MSRRPRPDARRTNSRQRMMIALVGWLFADLMLVIMVVAMASQPDPLANPPRPVAITHSPSPRPRPSPSHTGPRTLDLNPVIIHIDGPGDSDQQLIAQISTKLAPYVGKQAGMVLTFGDGPCLTPDTNYADRINKRQLLGQVHANAIPPMFPSSTATRSFISGGDGGSCLGEPATGADLDIYYYNSGS